MKKFEYKLVIEYYDNLQRCLNKYGEEGWELVRMGIGNQVVIGVGNGHAHLVFKREKMLDSKEGNK